MSTSSSAQDRDNQLLEVGKQCSDPSCLLVDFLPYKCHHCELSFCQDHFKVDAHKCPKYDENKHNRVAPNCPLCNIPVAVRPGQDPNVRMDMHLEKECSVVTGKVKSKSTPTCARGNCKKVLFSPIHCDNCKAQFCAAHRFPQDHNCSTKAQSKSTRQLRLDYFSTRVKNFNSNASAAGTATLDADKKASGVASTSRAAQPSTSSSSKLSLPFNKTESLSVLPSSTITVTTPPDAISNRTTSNNTNINNDTDNKPQPIIDALSFIPRPLFARARSERESRIKAMQARAKKGLLSEEEKAILATEMAAIKERGCVIM